MEMGFSNEIRILRRWRAPRRVTNYLSEQIEL